MRARSAVLFFVGLVVAGCGGGSSTATKSIGTSASKAPTTPTAPANPPPSTVTANPSGNPPKSHSGTPTLVKVRSSAGGTVKTALTSREPALVCGLYSKKALNSSFGGVQGCRSAVSSGGHASSVEIVRTKTSAGRAIVVAIPHGGPSSGERLTISLTGLKGDWQLQSIKSNTPVGP